MFLIVAEPPFERDCLFERIGRERAFASDSPLTFVSSRPSSALSACRGAGLPPTGHFRCSWRSGSPGPERSRNRSRWHLSQSQDLQDLPRAPVEQIVLLYESLGVAAPARR